MANEKLLLQAQEECTALCAQFEEYANGLQDVKENATAYLQVAYRKRDLERDSKQLSNSADLKRSEEIVRQYTMLCDKIYGFLPPSHWLRREEPPLHLANDISYDPVEYSKSIAERRRPSFGMSAMDKLQTAINMIKLKESFPDSLPFCEKIDFDLAFNIPAAKEKVIQLQLGYLLHAQKCRGSLEDHLLTGEMCKGCSLPFCIATKNVLKHISTCKEFKSCKTRYCATSRKVLSHWKVCWNGDCPICSRLRKAVAGTSNSANRQQKGIGLTRPWQQEQNELLRMFGVTDHRLMIAGSSLSDWEYLFNLTNAPYARERIYYNL